MEDQDVPPPPSQSTIDARVVVAASDPGQRLLLLQPLTVTSSSIATLAALASLFFFLVLGFFLGGGPFPLEGAQLETRKRCNVREDYPKGMLSGSQEPGEPREPADCRAKPDWPGAGWHCGIVVLWYCDTVVLWHRWPKVRQAMHVIPKIASSLQKAWFYVTWPRARCLRNGRRRLQQGCSSLLLLANSRIKGYLLVLDDVYQIPGNG